MILAYAGTSYGKDCLPCNGAAISRETYADLFTAIGTFWNRVDGQSDPGNTMFRVPDLRDRALFGIGSQTGLAETDGKGSGGRGGPYHHHDINFNSGQGGAHGHSASADAVGNHGHSYYHSIYAQIQQGTQGGFMGVMGENDTTYTTGQSGGHGHGVTVQGSNPANHVHQVQGVTSGAYGSDAPSFAGVQYVITTGVTP